MRSPETPYALKHGKYVVAVEHVLDVISTPVTTVLYQPHISCGINI
jgi:hypothetical protein